MTVPILPDSAPFTPAQRAWLNGFFAGLLNIDPQAALQTGVSAGSPSTTAVIDAPVDDIDPDDPPWHDSALTIDERLEMTESRPANDKMMAAMAQLDCGSCGYLCRTYADAIASGDEADLTLCVPGGKETSKTLKQIVKLSVSAGDNGSASSATAAAPTETGYSRKNPFPATLIDVKKLNTEGSAKDVRFIALDLDGSDLAYNVGDALGVYPENCTDLVRAILTTGGYTGDEPVPTPTGDVTLREALTAHYCITEADEDLALCLADSATDPDEAAALRKLAESDALDTMDLLDLLEKFSSARPKPIDLVENLAAIKPRLYSISSSLAAHPNEVHLTVGMVRYETNGRQRKGVASTYLGERVEIGEKVRLYIQPAHGFALPDDPATPIIMVGPGTGIAPFRAFLEQRAADNAPGKNWLFFGDQCRATDYLYESEMTAYRDSGLLTRIDTAFSRDQAEKVYVQHRMLEDAETLWQWLQDGAHFYVCGDASRMAKDVDAALHTITESQGGLSPDEAKAYIKQLATDNRYQRDVY